jgi:hypothetical protein
VRKFSASAQAWKGSSAAVREGEIELYAKKDWQFQEGGV